MNSIHSRSTALIFGFAFACFGASLAAAQTKEPAAAATATAPGQATTQPELSVDAGALPPGMEEDTSEAYDQPALQVGDATLNLLAWQSSGQVASTTPRPIAGDVANRSYERYLKSFEHPIPEYLSSSLRRSSGGGSGSSSR